MSRTSRKAASALRSSVARSRPRPGKRVLDGDAEARLIALACSKPPDGHGRWTLDLLADRLVRLSVVPAVSRDTVGRCLKKTRPSPWLIEQWCIPEPGGEFVWHMEDVLDVYKRLYDPNYPVVGLDEKPVQLMSHKFEPLPCQRSDLVRRQVAHPSQVAGSDVRSQFPSPASGPIGDPDTNCPTIVPRAVPVDQLPVFKLPQHAGDVRGAGHQRGREPEHRQFLWMGRAGAAGGR